MSVANLRLTTSGPEATREFAAVLGPLFVPGDVVALSGDLGAGKTCFVQGAVRGLGVDGRVTSPTFVLVRQYVGRLPIVHCDVYRLDSLQDVRDLGEDVLAPEVVTFIEWADAVRPLLPDDRVEVELLHTDDGDAQQRRIAVRAFGPSWAGRVGDLEAACAPWRDADPTGAAGLAGADGDADLVGEPPPAGDGDADVVGEPSPAAQHDADPGGDR